MNIFKNINCMPEVPTKPIGRLPSIVPIPMRVREINVITGNSRFTKDHLHTHRLADYARDLLSPVLLSDVYNPLDYLFAEDEVQ